MTQNTTKITWAEVAAFIASSKPRHVKLRGESLIGNDGTILSRNPHIAAGYVKSDWDAINCCATR